MTIIEIDQKINKLKNKLSNLKMPVIEVYSRIVGYHRNINNWNRGKREEYNYRVTYKVPK